MREAGSWRALRQEFGLGLPVLAYHHVGPRGVGADPKLTVSPEHFDRQVRWLAGHGYVGIRPSDWLAWCREGKPLPERPVLLTFDHGYADIAEFALPVLRRHGFGAGVYVVTGQIRGHNSLEQGRQPETPPLMSAAQIQQWAAQGIEFGSLGRTYTDLTALSDAQLAEEVEGSHDDLVENFGFAAGVVGVSIRPARPQGSSMRSSPLRSGPGPMRRASTVCRPIPTCCAGRWLGRTTVFSILHAACALGGTRRRGCGPGSTPPARRCSSKPVCAPVGRRF